MTTTILVEDMAAADAIFVIRGDLRSNTGYGKATRALAALLNARCSVMGVDIHFNPADQNGGFDYPLITDDDLAALAAAHGKSCFVLNYTTPDTFVYVDGATNIGCFYWESGALPQDWADVINIMERVWAPTTFVKDILLRANYGGPIDIVTWPHDFSASPVANRKPASVLARLIPSLTNGSPQTIDVATAPMAGPVYLAVQSLAPRKGLPILLSEWRDYLAKGGEGVLLLKLRFIHSTYGHGLAWDRLRDILAGAGFRPGERTSVILVSDDLTEVQMETLYARADAYVTATYGEGFGGPTVEALQRDTLVIVPRATGALDLLAPDYPLAASAREVAVGLRGGLNVYPHGSTWHIPERGSLTGAFFKFAEMSPASRTALIVSAKAFAASFCSIPQVQRQLDGALSGTGGVLS